MGANTGAITASYYNSETTGQSDTGKGVAKTTAELLAPTGSTGIYQTWNATDWDFGTNEEYPVLKIDVDGNGTVGDAADLLAQRHPVALIEVSTLEQLNAIRYDLDGNGTVDNGANAATYKIAFPAASDAGVLSPPSGVTFAGYELINNLDFKNGSTNTAEFSIWAEGSTATGAVPEGWAPVGSFSAIFEGNGHTISNLYINRPISNVGLFGNVSGSAALRNIGLLEVNVTGTGSKIGGLVGYNNTGTVSNSYATGAVTGSSDVGGLVGYSFEGTVSNSYATGAVTGTRNQVGGLVGRNDRSTVSNNSYATGAVTGIQSSRRFGGKQCR